jgi:ABC-type molybdate transport system ATPase subunit
LQARLEGRLFRENCSGTTLVDRASSAPTMSISIARVTPHLSVMRNLLYGARQADSDLRPGQISFDEVVELPGLAALLDRSPQNLSGGERQRVATPCATVPACTNFTDISLMAFDVTEHNEQSRPAEIFN